MEKIISINYCILETSKNISLAFVVVFKVMIYCDSNYRLNKVTSSWLWATAGSAQRSLLAVPGQLHAEQVP